MPDWLTVVVVTIAIIWLAIDVIVFYRMSQIDFRPRDQSGADTPHSKID